MRRWWILIAAVMMLSGCQMQKGGVETVGRPVVCKITVTDEQGVKIYTNEKKMQEILHKFRRLGQKFTPETDPESQPGEIVFVELFRSNGTLERYSIKGDRFLRKGNQPWQQTESRPLQKLMGLLETLPPDG
jgi:hypothetical protein